MYRTRLSNCSLPVRRQHILPLAYSFPLKIEILMVKYIHLQLKSKDNKVQHFNRQVCTPASNTQPMADQILPLHMKYFAHIHRSANPLYHKAVFMFCKYLITKVDNLIAN